MLGKFWGKGGSTSADRSNAVDCRGLEVVDDDPETSWSLWDNALEEQDSRYTAVAPTPSSASPGNIGPSNAASGFDETPTRPMDLEDLTDEQRITHALNVVDQYHSRVATTIRTFWGHKECPAYINKLIMDGDDGMGNARSGFNAQAVQAMLVLADLHDTIFGSM